MDLKTQLQGVVKGQILDDAQTLETVSKDASIFEIKPQIVIQPQDSADIQNLVKFINAHPDLHLSVTPRSAGTDMSGGPLTESILIEMIPHFNQILQVGSDFAITQPGVYYRDFEKETLKHDLLLPCYPASREINTVGGMVANNSAGEKTLIYGQTERYVRRLKVILSDGNEYEIKPVNQAEYQAIVAQNNFLSHIYQQVHDLISQNYQLIQSARPQVSKNSAGYFLWNVWDGQTFDLTKLIVGSQGTLGIVTEVEFKLIKPKHHSRLLVMYLNNLDNLAQIVNQVLQFQPESFESYDDQTMKVATKFLPEVIKSMGANVFKLAWQFIPEMWMAVVSGFPKLVMLAEFTDETAELAGEKALQAQAALKQFNIKTRVTRNEDEGKKYWTIRRESFNLLRHHSTHMRTAPFIDDIVVQPNVLPEFLPKLRAIMDKYKNDMVYTIAGHVGNGNFHIIPLMDFTKDQTKQIIADLSKQVYDLVIQYKGSITAEHNDGLIRGPFLQQMYGPQVWELFKQVKKIFDPNDIFNPHKKVDASFDYTFAHISHPSTQHPVGS